MKKKSLLVVILLVVIGICGWGYYQSTPATMDRLANAIQKKDLKTVKKYLPEYSDHSAIDESTYKVFMATNPSRKQIKEFLVKDCQQTHHGMFQSKSWEPRKRALSISGLEDVSGTKLLIIDGKQQLSLGKKNKVSLFPGKYQLTLKLNNIAYGTVNKTEKIDLTQDNQNLVLNPEISFEKSRSFHQTLMD